jgi:Fe-S-cluster containining protein
MGLGIRSRVRGGDLKKPRPLSKEQVLRRTALDEVRAVYRELENRPIERACERRTECCHFKLTGRTPQLTRGEAILAARALRASGRKAMPEHPDDACPMLKATGACMIYHDRPFGCRTHFCAAAGGPYARAEVLDLIRRLEAVDARLGGSGPRALPAAITDELRQIG